MPTKCAGRRSPLPRCQPTTGQPAPEGGCTEPSRPPAPAPSTKVSTRPITTELRHTGARSAWPWRAMRQASTGCVAVIASAPRPISVYITWWNGLLKLKCEA